MKKIILLIICFVFITYLNAQQVDWIKQAGGNFPIDRGTDIVYDAEGNYYVKYSIEGSSIISGTQHYAYFGNDSVYISGENDICIAKYSSSGNVLWAKSIGGDYEDFHHSLSEGGGQLIFDQYSNSLYMTTDVIGSLKIDSIDIGSPYGESDYQALICRINTNGDCIWAITVNSDGDDGGTTLSISDDHFLYLSGIIAKPATIANISLNRGCFVAKLNPENGGFAWIQTDISLQNAAVDDQTIIRRMVCSSNNIYLLIDKGTDSLTYKNTSFTNGAHHSIILKADTSANLIWAKEFGSNDIFSESMDLQSGRIYIAGSFKHQFYTPIDTITTDTDDHFWLILDTSGTFIHLDQLHISDYAGDCMIKAGSSGQYYVCGSYKGSGTIGGCNFTSSTDDNLYLSLLNEDGTCNEIYQLGHAEPFGLNYNPANDKIMCTGWILGDVSVGGTTLIPKGGIDAFAFVFSSLSTSAFTQMKPSNNGLYIYSNPSNGKFHIQLPDALKAESQMDLNIYNSLGECIYKKKINSSNLEEISIQNVQSGEYNMTLSKGGREYKGKLIIK